MHKPDSDIWAELLGWVEDVDEDDTPPNEYGM